MVSVRAGDRVEVFSAPFPYLGTIFQGLSHDGKDPSVKRKSATTRMRTGGKENKFRGCDGERGVH